MKFDIVLVTYNSSRHIERCFKALESINTPLEDLHLIIVDNLSTDDTLQKLKTIEEKNIFPKFTIIPSDKNLGFGLGCNEGARHGSSPYIFFLNIDTEISFDAIKEIEEEIIRSNEKTVSFELRQMPYEHPKIYNPVTLDTSWSSGAAVVIRRDAFFEVGGFDKSIFMYAEDVDLSWNLRKKGYNLKYVPKATLMHYTYENPGQIKPVQYYNSILNNLLLRAKYGNLFQIFEGWIRILAQLILKGPFKNSRRILLSQLIKRIPSNLMMLLKRPFRPWNFKFKPKFKGWDYEEIRAGAFFPVERVLDGPIISVLVRTVGRPAILRECLISLRNQTYDNFEVIVVEDGPGISEEMIKKEFQDLDIRYQSTGEKKGRCHAANIALEMARGEFLNFLDDDDLFYGDHLETLILEQRRHPDYKLYFSSSIEVKTEYISHNPLKYTEYSRIIFPIREFNRFRMTHENQLPIQAALFSRTLLEKTGGFDESLDSLEDWDFWLRCSFETDFWYVDKSTSLFRTPYHMKKIKARNKELDFYKQTVLDKYSKREYLMTFKEMRQQYLNALEQGKPGLQKLLKRRTPQLYKLLRKYKDYKNGR